MSTSDFGDLLHAISVAGRSIWVDTSGASLEAACQIANISLKVNDTEIGALMQCEVSSPEAACKAARDARRHGAATIIVTLAQAGAVLSAESGTWHAAPPVIQSVNATAAAMRFWVVGCWHWQNSAPCQKR